MLPSYRAFVESQLPRTENAYSLKSRSQPAVDQKLLAVHQPSVWQDWFRSDHVQRLKPMAARLFQLLRHQDLVDAVLFHRHDF